MITESVLRRLGKSSILVTDFANQFWCEKQMECNYLYGKVYTKRMERGRRLHEALQEEVYVPLTIEPVTYEDFMYKTAYENFCSLRSLKANGVCRELRVYGSMNGFRMSGQVDEMRLAGGKVRVVERKSTETGRRLTEVYTRPHVMQVMMYRKMLCDIAQRSYTFENFSASYGIGRRDVSDAFRRELVAMGVRSELLDMREMYKKMFEEMYTMPDISDRLEIAYMDRFSGKQMSSIEVSYNDEEMNRSMVHALRYWNGERDALPVVEAENWKCRFCKFFGKECKVWWKG